MTSKERHEARYRRRKAKRQLAKERRNEGHGFDEAVSFGALKVAYYKSKHGVAWKTSVLKYGENILRNSYIAHQRLIRGDDVRRGFVKFWINERGKKRFIQSVHISERVVQKALCDQALVPVIEKSLIYDNAASQKGKGTEFSSQRLVRALRRYYRRYGNDGYVVIGDAHAFFDSLRHDVVRANAERYFTDQRVIDLQMQFIDAFDHGLGLGSQVSQIHAVAYCNSIDHYATEILRPFAYLRYMDDWIAICCTKDEAHRLLEAVEPRYQAIGIELNRKKTQIVKISRGFTWLKDRIYLTETGKVIRKPCREKPARDRRKIKKLAVMLRAGEISYADVRSFAGSVKGYYAHKNGHRSWREFTKLYNKLIIKDWRQNEQDFVFE